MAFSITSSILGYPLSPGKTVEAIYNRAKGINPNFDRSIAEYYVNFGIMFNIRPEFAVSQAIWETGWFKFSRGHNPAGLKYGNKYLEFPSWKEGIHAHYERLSCYVRPNPMPGEGMYDPGSRGSNAHGAYYAILRKGYKPDTPLGIASLWAMQNAHTYSSNVVKIANTILAQESETSPARRENMKRAAITVIGTGGLILLRSFLV